MDDFIRKKIKDDLQQERVNKVHTRFPPEPNGYLHIGHAKSIYLNFGIAQEFSAQGIEAYCNLRFDDTNPIKEKVEYIESIKKDIRWLGCTWHDKEYYASHYFQKLYEYAIILIKKGMAYVDHCTADEIREMRGTPNKVGVESPYRNRTVEENLELFEAMKDGTAQEGSCLLRAKIDMKHPNIVMRDPPIYRIKDVEHHNTGKQWRIYPMYDFAHCLSDAIEGITHSLCTLEFEIHRPLYDWFIESVGITYSKPEQTEFARLNITYMVMSKRKMKELVDNKVVEGWDDPRMSTISGMRRRGYTQDSIKSFCDEIGVTKTNSIQDLARLEECLRNELNQKSIRVMSVIDPVKLILENYEEEKTELFDAINNPNDAWEGTHKISFSRELYIERDDIMEEPIKGFNRVTVGQEVRLKYAYYITCTRIVKDQQGKIVEIHAAYDPSSRGGGTPDNRKVRGTIHWINVHDAIDIRVNILDVLFTDPIPDALGNDFLDLVNPHSLVRVQSKAEPHLMTIINSYSDKSPPYPLQFVRKGYFFLDATPQEENTVPVFNQTVTLKDGWKKNK